MILQATGQHKPLTPKETAQIMAGDFKNFQQVKTYLCADMEAVRSGDVVKVGILFQIANGWNIYDNDTLAQGYLPTRVEWKVPDCCRVESVVWQAPVRLSENEGKMGYFHFCFVVVTIRVVEAPPADFEIRAEYEWQMCDEQHCIHRRGNSTIPIKVGASKKSKLHAILKKWNE